MPLLRKSLVAEEVLERLDRLVITGEDRAGIHANLEASHGGAAVTAAVPRADLGFVMQFGLEIKSIALPGDVDTG